MRQPIHSTYDRLGRQVSAIVDGVSTNLFTYSYLPNTDLISGMTASSGFLWTRAYESARSLITSVENRHGETVISRYDYTNDQLGRRTSRADSGLAFANPAFDTYSYNNRSEVTGAQRYPGTDVSDTSTVYGGREFGYAYDPIGNRTSASETIGGETLAKAYTANALNQYTAIANPAAVGLRGDATNTAVVTVNGLVVQSDDIASDSIPWHFALVADNAAGPDFPFAEIVAVINPPGTNTPDIVSTASGHLYAPPRSETLTYDLDGNLLSDGRWEYTWNGENRLIKAEELVSTTNRQPYTVEYAYDHQGRMVWKQISTNAVVVSTRTLLWDGYNIVQALTHAHTHTLTNSFLWGLDLSGTLQGTGGVGGLLAEVQDGEPYFAAFDANGNVTEYNSANGTISAHYEYSPFGETVVQSGDLAASFSHRFSTKPWCPVTGFSEYEMRKYGPGVGRWLSRDPIGERGGLCLYVIVNNAPSNGTDDKGALPSWGITPPNQLIPSLPGFPQQPTEKPIAIPGILDPYLGDSSLTPKPNLRWDDTCLCKMTDEDIKVNFDGVTQKQKKLLAARQNGWAELPDDLSASYGECLISRLNNIQIKCANDDSVACKGNIVFPANTGFAFPFSGVVNLCVKNAKDTYGSNDLSSLILHEMVHVCGKIGHSDWNGDNPRHWEGWFADWWK